MAKTTKSKPATARKPSFIAYYRVSTAQQGASGLGLDAQRDQVRRCIGEGRIIAEFTEVESGKDDHRPKLAEALAHCELHGATLAIAKLDRLSRNVAFIANLMDSSVEFVAADFPQANRLTLHILAAVAEHEREAISQRTTAALAAARARGVKLGNPRLQAGTAETAAHARAAHVARSVELAQRYAAPIAQARAAGAKSLAQVADALTKAELPTPRGAGAWNAEQVRRVLRKLDAESPATAA